MADLLIPWEKPKYAWKDRVPFKSDPEKAHMVMEDLEEKGTLNAQTLVDVSREEGTVLHDDFEWNDAVAGEEWRKEQARLMMRSLVVIEIKEQKPMPPQRVFFNIPENKSNYESLQVILKSESKTESLVKQALQELRCYKARYANILKQAKAFETTEALVHLLEGYHPEN